MTFDKAACIDFPAHHLHRGVSRLKKLTRQGCYGCTSAYLPRGLSPQGLAVILDLPLLSALAVGAHYRLHLVSSVFALLLCLHRVTPHTGQSWYTCASEPSVKQFLHGAELINTAPLWGGEGGKEVGCAAAGYLSNSEEHLPRASSLEY